ncbi:UDP-N-acetylmuramate--L-alanine ligase [Candidatus Persebacteraceae bacterium Df01]|jgi:UDP-N-acetylmuramate--alanine ligase|uniref:UDP-N-acetylmuramate--L-alanine ligase n=1 Tax=Candidatus Doriopsillibacter californiensis TaxID=2970740 RepID=A0ABT7QLG9_9GAMM|nr:UDP-N-acetylmuramate--L-alanine ligase [Candidatus Persebacteraceae bacterium Df01]
MRHKIRHIHFVGIGGAGMCGLAEVMQSLGYAVSGSDTREQPSLVRLRAAGVTVFVGHAASHADNADCVVYSGAVPTDNPERIAAAARGVPVIPRAQMLGEVLRFKPGIAVAGTHGKTTVSSMLAAILTADGRAPTCIIGGLLQGNDNAHIGGGEFTVVEADESDASFLHLQPVAAVITNIDNDHLPAFGGDMAELQKAFAGFVANLPFYGAAIICIDSPPAATLAAELSAVRVTTYGFAETADVRVIDVRTINASTHFTLNLPEGTQSIELRVAGRHNAQNAAGACAAARELGVEAPAMAAGLHNFSGVGRRLETHGALTINSGTALLIDDYAHHPTEITATLETLRDAYPGRRILLAFQPHRYTRTRDVFTALVDSLSLADVVVLLDVYPAGEKPIAGADSAALTKVLQTRGTMVHPVPDLSAAQKIVHRYAKDNDVVMTMGAGNVGALPKLLLEAS